jgi:branched-chain amino acid aminotransferase
MDTYYIDGRFVTDDQAFISVKDIVVLRGFGVFDFLITYNRRPFHLETHIRRLENSAGHIGLTLHHRTDEMCDIVTRTIDKNSHHDESNIRIVYSGGISADGVSPEGNGILMVMVTPRRIPPQTWYEDGAKVITVPMERFIPLSKSTNYLSAVFALEEAKKQNAIESLYVDRRNRILEGTTTNFFCFKDDRTLITPEKDILPGVTRGVILDLVKDTFQVELRDIDKGELPQMQEIFISASNKEVVPIVQVDSHIVGDGTPGEKTRRIMKQFRDYTTAYGQGKI